MGAVETLAAAGSSIGPHGEKAEGTLGAFGHDRFSGRPVAFTAMHVAHETLMAFPGDGHPTIRFVSPFTSGSVFGRLLRGTRHHVDAAAIELVPDSQERLPSPFGEVRGWRPLSFPADVGTPVKLWGARTGFATGVVTDPGVFLAPSFLIDFAIIAEIPTRRGDSGAALLDNDNWVLGFLHAAAPRKGPHARLFVPASAFLASLGCDLP
jgi:hypothetical protein